MDTHPGTVGEILDKLPPVEGEARPVTPEKTKRGSATVLRLNAELANALKLREMLGNDAEADPQLLLDTLEGETNLAEMVCVLHEETLSDQAMLDGTKAMIATLQERASGIERRIETKRGLIMMAMDRSGLGTIRGPLATFSLRDTKPKLVVGEESQIPSRFFKPADPKLDRDAVKTELEAGKEVPGASLSNPGISLTIRMK
jgi:hypothetical protein